MLIIKYFPIVEKKNVFNEFFFIKIIERMKNCYSHIVTNLQYGKRLHKVILRHRLAPEKE